MRSLPFLRRLCLDVTRSSMQTEHNWWRYHGQQKTQPITGQCLPEPPLPTNSFITNMRAIGNWRFQCAMARKDHADMLSYMASTTQEIHMLFKQAMTICKWDGCSQAEDDHHALLLLGAIEAATYVCLNLNCLGETLCLCDLYELAVFKDPFRRWEDKDDCELFGFELMDQVEKVKKEMWEAFLVKSATVGFRWRWDGDPRSYM